MKPNKLRINFHHITVILTTAFMFAASMTPGMAQTRIEGESYKATVAAMTSLNQRLPIMVDEETKWTRISVSGYQVTYDYTLVNYKARDLPDEKQFMQLIRHLLGPQICTREEVKPLMSDGFSLNYVYTTADGKKLGPVTITAKDCQTEFR